MKLYIVGINGDLWNRFKGYPTRRQQCVRMGNSIPTSGLRCAPGQHTWPPILFLVYLNDSPLDNQNINMFLFADDMKCKKHMTMVKHCEELQEDLDSLGNWSKEWKINFKEIKCVHMSYCMRVSPIIYHQ